MTLVGTLEQQAEALEREAAAVRKLVDAARDLGEERVAALLAPMLSGNGNGNGDGNHAHEPLALTLPADEPPEGLPRGRQAIRMIVYKRPGLWTLRELRAEMMRRGWFVSNKGVDVAVKRMCAAGEARRVGTGRYEFYGPEGRDAP